MNREFGFSILLMLSAAAHAAPPSTTYLFPAGARQGSTVEITAGGSFERWPPKTWVSGEGVQISPTAVKGKLIVTVADDAELGSRWLRLFDERGASTPRPFLVADLPEIREQEPNDELTKAQPIVPPTIVNGRLDKNNDVDTFAITLKQGQTLSAAVEAHETLRSPIDAVLQIVSPAGFVLEQANDTRGLDPALNFVAPTDGTYIVRLFAFPAMPDASIRLFGSEAGVYRLRLLNSPLPEPTTSSSPSDFDLTVAADQFTLTVGKPLDVPVTITHRPGFTREIEIAAEGLPPGVSATPTGKSDGKTVMLRFSADQEAPPGPFRIIGRTTGSADPVRRAGGKIAGFDATITELWLTVLAKTPND